MNPVDDDDLDDSDLGQEDSGDHSLVKNLICYFITRISIP